MIHRMKERPGRVHRSENLRSRLIFAPYLLKNAMMKGPKTRKIAIAAMWLEMTTALTMSVDPINVKRCGLSGNGKWVSDSWLKGVVWSAELKQVLRDVESEFQRITVVDTVSLGRALILDGALQCAERDERGYHELLTHVPVLRRKGPKKDVRALIVGGGDGGIARELLKYDTVSQVHLVEIDSAVVDAAKELLPTMWPSKDDRLSVIHADAAAFVKEDRDYDVIIVDASDPIGPGVSLYTTEFYENLKDRLTRRRGAAVVQAGSFWYLPRVLRTVYNGLRSAGFHNVSPYTCFTAVYPGGQWNLVCATTTSGDDPRRPHRRRALRFCRENPLDFYDPDIHTAAFTLPPLARHELSKPPPSPDDVARDLDDIYSDPNEN